MRDGSTHAGLEILHDLAIKRMLHSHTHRPICWRQFLHSSTEAPYSHGCHLENHHQPSRAAAVIGSSRQVPAVPTHTIPKAICKKKNMSCQGNVIKKNEHFFFSQKEKTELPQASYFTTAQTSQNAERWCISPYYLFSSHLQDTFYSHLLVANSLIASSCDNNPVVFLFAQRGKEDNCFVDWSVFLLLMLCCAKHTVSRRFLLCVVVLRVFVLDPQDRQGTFFPMLLGQKETVEHLKSQ